MTTSVAADGIRKVYDDVVALDGVSLSVEEGEVFALIGPNGAGKTTLVRSLTGTTRPTDGNASLFGHRPGDVDKSRLGVLPQSFGPPERLTARELVEYYAGLYDVARDPEEVLETVGVAEKADARYESLSGGQQRRVCIGIALVNDPDVLFLDEPTTGVDPVGRRTIREQIATLSGGGTTVFLTTHDMVEVEKVADRVGLLADGSLVAVGTPRELVREHGGDTRLVVECDASPTVLADADYRVGVADGTLRVYGVDPTDIGDVVAHLDDAGVEYTSLEWSEPTLEDVYVALTGEAFEKEEVSA